MTIQQIEKSNPEYTPDNLTLLTVHSSALKGRGNISVYGGNTDKKDIPIVVLMHGVYGNNWVWMNLGGVHQVYDRLLKESQVEDMLLVMPEDGSYFGGSGYLPLANGLNFEKWIVEDMLECVTQSLECVSKNSNVYISGLSMGGYGALRLGAKYPALFSGISGHSSITQVDELEKFVEEDMSLYQCEQRCESDVVYWVDKNKDQLPPLRFDCGREDILYQGNLAFAEALKEKGVTFEFSEFDGGHEWPYWNKHVATTLKFFNDIELSK